MDTFASEILSYKSIYLIAVGVYITLALTAITYKVSSRKWKPKPIGIPIVFLVTFFHLHLSGLDWNSENIFKAIFLAILTYISAFGLAAAIANIVRSTTDQKEMDATYGRKN